MQKATVIINTVNEVPERLRMAINSYKAQVGIDLQIIVSTIKGDLAIEIGSAMDCDIVINPRKGMYSQLNNALHYIKGDWISVANVKDIALPNKIFNEISACLLDKYDKLVCYSDYYLNKRKTATPLG